VVGGRPDKDIRDTRKVEMVVCRGQVVNRASLKYDAATDPGFRPFAAVSAGR